MYEFSIKELDIFCRLNNMIIKPLKRGGLMVGFSLSANDDYRVKNNYSVPESKLSLYRVV